MQILLVSLHLRSLTCATPAQNTINEARIPIVRCPEPGCGGAYAPEDVFAAVENTPAKATLPRLNDLLADAFIGRSIHCPYTGCTAKLGLPDDMSIPDAECLGCRRQLCMVCVAPWHSGLSCAEFQAQPVELRVSADDLAARQVLVENGGWQCPACGEGIERADGCNFMLCICGKAFCYACGQQYLDLVPTPRNQHGQPGCDCGLFVVPPEEELPPPPIPAPAAAEHIAPALMQPAAPAAPAAVAVAAAPPPAMAPVAPAAAPAALAAALAAAAAAPADARIIIAAPAPEPDALAAPAVPAALAAAGDAHDAALAAAVAPFAAAAPAAPLAMLQQHVAHAAAQLAVLRQRLQRIALDAERIIVVPAAAPAAPAAAGDAAPFAAPAPAPAPAAPAAAQQQQRIAPAVPLVRIAPAVVPAAAGDAHEEDRAALAEAAETAAVAAKKLERELRKLK